MFKFYTKKKGAIFYMEFLGHIEDDEALKAEKVFNSRLEEIRSCRVLVSDISKFNSGTRLTRLILQRCMHTVKELKPKFVVRVIENYFGAVFFDRAYNMAKADYNIYKPSTESEYKSLKITLEE